MFKTNKRVILFNTILIIVIMATIVACSSENQRNLKKLGYALDDKGFRSAVSDSNLEAIKIFINEGLNVNSQDSVIEFSLLMIATCRADKKEALEIMKLLLQNNADIEAKDTAGQTAVTLAAEHGNVDALKLLISYGADVNARLNNGDTALSEAIENGHTECISLLKQNGAYRLIQSNN